MNASNNYTQEKQIIVRTSIGDVDGTSYYLREIGKIPRLTKEEEEELAKKIKFGTAEEAKAARNKFINSNLRLVVSVAKKFARKYNEPLMETIQEGNLGLMRAVETFDYSKGFKFSTYAEWWIQQKIRRAHAESCQTIRLPVHMHEKVLQFKKCKTEFIIKHHKEPTVTELAEMMGETEKTIIELTNASKEVISLETPISDDEDGAVLMDFVADEQEKNESNLTETRLLIQQLLEEVAPRLTENENMVLRRRFGFISGRVETLEEIATDMKITRERVRQIEAQALRRIKQFIKGHPRYKEIV